MKGEFEELLVVDGFVLCVDQFAVGRVAEDAMNLRRLPLDRAREMMMEGAA